MQLGVLLAESAQTGGSEHRGSVGVFYYLQFWRYKLKKKIPATRDRYMFGMNRKKSFFHILLLIVVHF